ncbi:hypothetical protein AOC36_08765 [Erysipelothrix larvae]|uniref:Sortase n=1 Tax=Erysipelothrix larvae TaxID=1514105 RepID=A0A0X8H0Z3_9FIRM|nr:class D sortase [Erysipelothrix larvae]AMC94076.1 hypothetical protein AOC36_08765 [Erysipelothrix larvae]
MNKKHKKLLAYIYVPITFTFLSYLVLGVLLSPFFEIVTSVAGMVAINQNVNYGDQTDSVLNLTDIHDGFIELKDLTLPNYGEHYAQLVIDRIELETPLYYGDDYALLRKGAGQYIGSVFPGFKGTTLIAGHNTRGLRPIRNAEVGDIVNLQTSYGNYEYKIYDIQLVHESEYALYLDLSQTKKDIIVMYTCYPFDGLVGLAKQRLFVYAEKVKGPTIIDGGVNE